MELEDDDDDSEQGGVSLSQEPEQLTRLEPQNERVEGGTARPHKVVRVGEEEKELSGMSCGGTMKHEPKEEEDVLQNTSLDALDAKHERAIYLPNDRDDLIFLGYHYNYTYEANSLSTGRDTETSAASVAVRSLPSDAGGQDNRIRDESYPRFRLQTSHSRSAHVISALEVSSSYDLGPSIEDPFVNSV